MRSNNRKILVARYQKWMKEILAALELSHWDLKVDCENTPEHPDAMAEVCITPGRNQAYLTFSDGFWTASPTTQREIFVHECLHLHHRALGEFRGRLEQNLGPIIGAFLVSAHQDAEEWAVDAIAVAIAKFLPEAPAQP